MLIINSFFPALPVVRVQSNSYSVLLGQTTTLVCTISANPSATSVLWYKVISGVQSGLSTTPGKYNSPTVSSPNLVINTAALNDAGYYVCTATNVVGTGTSSQTYLDVTGSEYCLKNKPFCHIFCRFKFDSIIDFPSLFSPIYVAVCWWRRCSVRWSWQVTVE
jgi:hypothetical protein